MLEDPIKIGAQIVRRAFGDIWQLLLPFAHASFLSGWIYSGYINLVYSKSFNCSVNFDPNHTIGPMLQTPPFLRFISFAVSDM